MRGKLQFKLSRGVTEIPQDLVNSRNSPTRYKILTVLTQRSRTDTSVPHIELVGPEP